MQKKYFWFMFFICVGLIHCGGGSDTNSSSPTDTTALEYATYGVALSQAIPDGLKQGGAELAGSLSALKKTLTDACAADYTNCPFITEENGGDSPAGEILMRLWALDYDDECTDELIVDGTCFECFDCMSGDDGPTAYIQPTMLADPDACATTSTTDARYVNFGTDPCFFDAMIAQINNVDDCATVAGGDVAIDTAVPWFASWGIPETIDFSSYYAQSEGGMWWTVNAGVSGEDQYFLSLSPDWLHMGFKNATTDTFLFFASGSAAYYEALGEWSGEGSGVNIAAYAGSLSAITQTFEAIQIRDQEYTYIERMRVNATHLWYQSWDEASVPQTPDDVADVKDTPSDNRCLEIGDSIVASRYVPFEDCVTAFGAADVNDLNGDENYTLKMIDIQTAGSIAFGTPITDTPETSCLEENAQ